MAKVSEESPQLYHYTNEQGLYGILDNQCIWATHYKFLNDYSEIILFREKLIEFLYPPTFEYFEEMSRQYPNFQEIVTAKGGLDIMVRHDNEVFVDESYKILNHEIYIASFCKEHEDNYINNNGLLSQWRAYGGDGGFAIVFKTLGLEEILSSERDAFHYDGFLIADVIYSDDEEKYKSELSEPLSKISTYQKEIYRQISEQILEGEQQPSNVEDAYPDFVQCITRYKDRGFKEEQEIRIVAMPTVLDRSYREIEGEEHCNSKLEKKREFRDKNGRRTPYIELFRSLDGALPIEKIIVGPHKDKEIRAATLRIYLRNTDIEVTVSEIPFSS